MQQAIAIIVASVAAVVVLSVVAFIVAKSAQRRLRTDSPTYGRWYQLQQQLAQRDKVLVKRATARQRPVERADLEPAQLAYVRLCRQLSERSALARRPRLRFAIAAAYMVCAVCDVASEWTQHGLPKVAFAVGAVVFIALGVYWGVVVPNSVHRRAEQMARLQQRIEKGGDAEA